MIYQWYKILSPHIDVTVDSVSFDETNSILYVGIHQTFKIWLVPFYKAQPNLVTVLRLTTDPYSHYLETSQLPIPEQTPTDQRKPGSSNSSSKAVANKNKNYNGQSKKKYYIQSQNDLYQTSEFIKFLLPWSVGVTLMVAWQFWATLLCVIGAILCWPITWLLENVLGGNLQRVENSEILGKD